MTQQDFTVVLIHLFQGYSIKPTGTEIGTTKEELKLYSERAVAGVCSTAPGFSGHVVCQTFDRKQLEVREGRKWEMRQGYWSLTKVIRLLFITNE